MNLARTIFFSLLMLGGIIGLAIIIASLGLAPLNPIIILLIFVFILFIIIGWIFAIISFSREKNERRC